MTSWLIVSLAVGGLSFLAYTLPFRFAGSPIRYATGIVGSALITLLLAGLGYLALPAINLWSLLSWGPLAMILCLPLMFLGGVLAGGREHQRPVFRLVMLASAGGGLLVMGLFLMQILPFFQIQSTYAQYIRPSVARAAVPAVSGANLPIVPQSSALAKLQNTIGSYGTQYAIRNIHIERWHGGLYWVGAIDFRSGYFRWLHLHSAPGYAMVSATDPNAAPTLHTGYGMVYTPMAHWNENLVRHVWFAYPQYALGSADLEVSPRGTPYYAVSAYNMIQEGAFFQAAGVILVNPHTGAMTFFRPGKAPGWVSQVVGPNTALSWASAFGKDSNAPLQVMLNQASLMGPVGSPAGVMGPGGKLFWYIGMTSSSSSDQSLTGYLLIDAETGTIRWYPEGNGLQNAQAVQSMVDGVLQNRRLSASRPLFYNVDGRDAYIVPVVNTAGKMEEVAIADARNQATPVVAGSLPQALLLWQEYLATGNGTANVAGAERTRAARGVIYRIAPAGGGVYDFMLAGSTALYSVTTGVYPYAPLVQAGDRVSIRYAVFPGSAVRTVSGMADGQL